MTMRLWKKACALIIFMGGVFFASALDAQKAGTSSLASLLPQPPGWEFAEAVRPYNPQTLFEYIDGAAEAYLSYDFKELVVAQYRRVMTKVTLTAEIYDMGTNHNAFGIYSAERYPENRFLPLGVQGYIEQESLNFFAGRFYVKLMCFEGAEKTEDFLKLIAEGIAGKVKEKGSFPALLQVFPQEGRIANSERFMLRNFMGFKFLNGGYTASYGFKDQEFNCFLIEAESAEAAEAMMKQYMDNFTKSGQALEGISSGMHFKNSYLKNVFVAKSNNYFYGVIKIKDEQESTGVRYLEAMRKALEN
jgi:hypothetical protein